MIRARCIRHARDGGNFGKPNGLLRRAGSGALTVLLILPASAHATPQPQPPINAAIYQSLGLQAPGTTVTIGSTAGAAAMAACTAPLAATITGTPPYEQAAVTCPAPFWTLYVTVTLAAHATIAVTARPVAAGATLTADDLTLTPEPVSLYAGRQVFYDVAPLTGSTTLMSLPAGAILTSGNISPPVIVRAGQTVAVAITTGNITVSLTATALAQGRVGDTITLANPTTGKHFAAFVTPTGPIVNLNE